MLKFSKTQDNKNTQQQFLSEVDISAIKTNPYQPRKIFNEQSITELALSIKNFGLLQPISLRYIGGIYELIAGERRLRACKMLGMTKIKALIITGKGEQDSAMLAMIENLQRENLHFFEEAEGYVSLMKEHGFTQEMLARKLSKNQSTVANKLRLLKLPKPIKEEITRSGLSERHARALLRLHNEESQQKLLKVITKNGCSVRETEHLVEAELKRIYDGDDSKKKLAYIFRDYRIYINTIKKAVSQVNDAGVITDMDILEKDDEVKITVILKKPESVPKQAAR